jgi:pyruvate-formate lyase
MRDVQRGDLFAGRTGTPLIGFIGQENSGSIGYYCNEKELRSFQQEHAMQDDDNRRIDELIHFWGSEATVAKAKEHYSEQMKNALPSDLYSEESGIVFTLWRMSGIQMDYEKLVRLGIPGLRIEITGKLDTASEQGDSRKLYEAMLIALDTFGEVCSFFAWQTLQKACQTENPLEKAELIQMSEILKKLPNSKPESFREGLQLIFLYTVLDGSRNFGRLDDALGELYCHDIDEKIITEEEGVRLLTGVWKLIIARNFRYDSRMIIGGLGRVNEQKANRLAMAIMETTRQVKDIVPQLALRFNKQQDPALYAKALDVLGEGNTFPMLYNDDVNIPAVQKAFEIPYEEAIHAIQFGCGEYVLNHRSVGTPSGVINILAALNVTLNKGIDPVTGKPIGMPLDRYDKYSDFQTFDDLFRAYKEQVEFHIEPLSEHEKLEYDFAGFDAPFLFTSMLMDDCIERGKGVFEGGVRYLGGTLELYGCSNTADSLVAIRQLVYEQKKIILDDLRTVLKNNFEGYEKERKLLLDCPKYGNDDETADEMFVTVHNHVCNFTRAQSKKYGLHSYLIVNINNDANTLIGEHTSASPDGRKAFTFMNPGNAPVGGADKNGLTAFLNSVVKPSPEIHAGYVQNMKFSKEMFTDYRVKFEMLMSTYWEKGGTQAMLTVIGRKDLEEAMIHPELYQNLIVRVGGFSERFVNLPKLTQLELLSRTLY